MAGEISKLLVIKRIGQEVTEIVVTRGRPYYSIHLMGKRVANITCPGSVSQHFRVYPERTGKAMGIRPLFALLLNIPVCGSFNLNLIGRVVIFL